MTLEEAKDLQKLLNETFPDLQRPTIINPVIHVMVCSPTGIFHGTNKHGVWAVEQIDPESFTRWLLST